MSQYEWEEADSSNPWGRKRVRGTHCSKGHEFTPENTFVRPYDKTRVCRECRRQYARQKYQENKTAGKAKAKPKVAISQEFMDALVHTGEAKIMYAKLMNGLLDHETPCMVNPDPFDTPEKVSLDQAEQLCYNCPLLKQCYDYAVTANVPYGIWGGVNFTKEEYYDEWFTGEGDGAKPPA